MDEQTPPLPEPDKHLQERGSSGFGTLLALGTAALATVSLVALFSALGASVAVTGAVVGGLGLLAGSLLVMQHHKEKVNENHVNRNYAEEPGYHKEPGLVNDLSLLHKIKGRSDLPARVQYIKDNYGEYGIKPLSPDQYRTRYLGTGAALGLLAGAAVMTFIAALAPASLPMLALGGVMGTLSGGLTLGLHTAHTMKRYDAYVDSLAAEGEARKQEASKRRDCAPAVEYDNGCARRRTYCEEVTASRCEPAEVVVCR